MGDYGIKISKPFYDAQQSGDADMLFSSAWPSIAVAKEVEIPAGTTSYAHNLGFPPFPSAWQKSYQPLTPTYSQEAPNAWTRIGTLYNDLSVDENNVYFPSHTDITHIKLYNIDISTQQSYRFVRPSAVRKTYDPNFGIRVAKEGEDINSDDLRDFLIHSRAQSPLVLSVVTSVTDSTGGYAEFTDPQGYTSWVFGFIRNTTTRRWNMIPYISQAYPSLSITRDSQGRATYSAYYVSFFGDDASSLVVLRDPMFAATDFEVTY